MNMHAQFFNFRKKPALSNTNIMNLKTAKKITCLFCLVSGLGFHFEINDLPIFLKGANWIPAGISVFHQLKFSSWGWGSPSDFGNLREQGNMNLFREWGNNHSAVNILWEWMLMVGEGYSRWIFGWGLGLFLKSPKTFWAYFGCQNEFPLYLSHQTLQCSCLLFLSLKSFIKTSRLQFDNWLFRPEKFSGPPLKGPLFMAPKKHIYLQEHFNSTENIDLINLCCCNLSMGKHGTFRSCL